MNDFNQNIDRAFLIKRKCIIEEHLRVKTRLNKHAEVINLISSIDTTFIKIVRTKTSFKFTLPLY